MILRLIILAGLTTSFACTSICVAQTTASLPLSKSRVHVVSESIVQLDAETIASRKKRKLAARATFETTVDGYVFPEEFFYKLATDGGEVVVRKDESPAGYSFWKKGKNEVFRTYDNSNLDSLPLFVSPYMYFSLLKERLSQQGADVTEEQGENGVSRCRIAMKPEIEGNSFNRSIFVAEYKGNTIQSVTCSIWLNDNGKITENKAYEMVFSQFDATFPELPRVITAKLFSQYEATRGNVNMQIDTKVTALEAVPSESTPKLMLAKLTTGMQSVIPGSSHASRPSGQRRVWILGAVAIIIAGAIFFFVTKSSPTARTRVG